jgi:hypothetical protein
VILERKEVNMLDCKRLALPALIAMVVISALIVSAEVYADNITAKARAGRVSERIADLRVSGPADVTITSSQSTEPENTGYPSVRGDYPPFDVVHVDMVTPGDAHSDMTITRVWTVTDALGNEKVETQKIRVVDDEPPEITCPPDVMFECDSVGELGEATAVDNMDQCPVITHSDEIIWQRCPFEYIKIRTWTATDYSGNSSSCEQTIRIEDSTPPVMVCPNDTTVACDELENLPHAEAWDNCVEDLYIDYKALRVDDFPNRKYVVYRTWEVTDSCCNKVGCTQVVTLIDTIPPVLECAPDDTIPCGAQPVFTDPTASDQCERNCTIEVLRSSSSSDPTNGNEVFTKCWVARDNFGNESQECCQNIVRLPCDEYCTFTQGGWGNTCPTPQQGNPYSTQSGCIRDYYFGSVFPSGVTIGIPAGSTHGATWTSAAAVRNFLPAGGTPAALTGDLTDPTTTPAGILAGQILALRLNREFSCYGAFGYALNPVSGCLGPSPVPEDCKGRFGDMTVDEFLALADQAIAGVPGVLDPYGASLSDLNDAATCINEYYDNCGGDAEPEPAETEKASPVALGGTPAEFSIEAITPNPLKGNTTIKYALPSEGRVKVEIFDIQGRKVATVLDEHMSAGYHGVMWDGRDGSGENSVQGVYFCRVQFEDRPAIMHKLIKVE